MIKEQKTKTSASTGVKNDQNPGGDVDSDEFVQEPFNGVHPLDVEWNSSMLFDESNASSPASINIDDLFYESEFEKYVLILEPEMQREPGPEALQN